MTREYIQSALAFINKHHQTSKINLCWNASKDIDLSFSNWSKFPLKLLQYNLMDLFLFHQQ